MRKIILVTSASCPPCHRLKQTFWDAEIVPYTKPEQSEIVPVEGNFRRVRDYQVKHAPCILLLDNDVVKARFYGNNHPSAKEMIDWINKGCD